MQHPRRWLVAAGVLVGLVTLVLLVLVPAVERRVGDGIVAELQRIRDRGAPVLLPLPPEPPAAEDGWRALQPLLAALQDPETWSATHAPGSPLVGWVQGNGAALIDDEALATFEPWLAAETTTLEGIALATTHERWRPLGTGPRERSASYPFERILAAGQGLAAWGLLAAHAQDWVAAARAAEALFRLGRTVHPQPLTLQFAVWSGLRSTACRLTAELARRAPADVDLSRLRNYMEPGGVRAELVESLRNERAAFLEILGVLDERGELVRPVSARSEAFGLGWWLLHSIQLRDALRGLNDLLERIEDAPDFAALALPNPSESGLNRVLPSWYAATAPAYASMVTAAQRAQAEAEDARRALDAR